MVNPALLEHLGLIIISAAVFLCLTRRLGVPAIVVYLFAGLIIGPWTGLLNETPDTDLITEAGIVLLLFLVGLELTFERIRGVGKVAVIAGSSQMAITVLGGAGICFLLGFRGSAVWILGFAVAFSSTVVAVKMLVSHGQSHALFGQIAIGILLVQDIVVVLLLTVIGALGNDIDGGGSKELISGMALALGGMLGLLIVVLVVAKYVLPKPLAWAARSPETLFIFSLCWCFLVVLATHALHLSHEIGAFIAGVSLAQLPYNHDLQRRVQPLMNFFVAVFFVTLGIGMQFQAEIGFWFQALLLSFFVLAGKVIIITTIIVKMRYRLKTAFFAGVTLSQISEFSFILAAVAWRAGLLDEAASSLLGVVGLITITTSSVAMANKERLFRAAENAGWFRLLGPTSPEDPSISGQSELKPPPRDHTVIVGMNTLGRELVRRLTARGEMVIAVDTDPEKLAGLPCETLLGDASMLPVLEEAGFEQARLLISTLHIAPANELLAYRCREANTPCSIHAFDLNGLNNLLDMDVAYLIVPKVDGIKRQNAVLKEMGFLAK